MTKADQIRKLRARGMERGEIAKLVGISLKHVSAQNWMDDNRETRRAMALRWQQKARQNPAFYAAELAQQRQSYRRRVSGGQ